MTRRSQPNFTTVQPDGSIGAVFPGGLIIPAGADFPIPPPVTRAIRWESSDGTGALRAFIYTQDNGGGGNQLAMTAMNDPGPLPDFVTVGVTDVGGGIMSALEVIESVGGIGSIYGFADRPGGTEQRLILDGNSNSSFIQAAAALVGGDPGQFALIGGFINGATGGLANGTAGFTPSRTVLGRYTIALDSPSKPVVMVCAAQASAATYAHVSFVGGSSWTYDTRNSAGALVDSNSMFLALVTL